ncbi:MAG: amidase, partial [Patescibacteria group bacterium]
MDLHRLTITEARDKLKAKEITAEELVKDCLARIKSLDEQVKAYVTVDEQEVLNQVSALDEGEREDQPLWGIPIAVKDNFLTCGLRTTASSKVLEDFSPVYESTVTQRLKNAGAIILGKTNMDAWAHGSSTETSQFFTTHNPWDLNRLPGGSSGGSGAAVAADMAIGSIGSETAGSIRQPAAWCGVTGLKPTYGVVSRYGVIAMASSTDSPGPMTKNAKDARVIFDIIRGRDPHDATSVEFIPPPIKDLSQITIGVPKEYFLSEIEEEVKQKVLEAIKVYERLGLKTVEVSLLDPRISISVYTIVQRSEVSSNLGRYDGVRYGNGRTSFGDEAKRRIMLGTYTLSSGYYDAYYLRAEKVRTLILEDFDRVFKEV